MALWSQVEGSGLKCGEAVSGGGKLSQVEGSESERSLVEGEKLNREPTAGVHFIGYLLSLYPKGRRCADGDDDERSTRRRGTASAPSHGPSRHNQRTVA